MRVRMKVEGGEGEGGRCTVGTIYVGGLPHNRRSVC